VVTIAGGHFASRVSASILTAAQLPELITSTLKDYEALALRLAGDAAALAGIRAKLAGIRSTAPLFDGARFVAVLERAYQTMWQRFNAGEAPQAFAVPPIVASGPA
jgi:predicted O-linked N-acetylglucosamine transferase (SPINDLY family)